jgi:tritrans,polycis-undecaprenyl-diphosphate synthase [geranylgeranyl-diphosphate specific]
MKNEIMLKKILSILGIYRVYRKWLLYQVSTQENPEHIAIILDGNRRWALNHYMDPSQGHHFGAAKTDKVLRWLLEIGVKTVTFYAFSTENFLRPRKEVEEIMDLISEKLLFLIKDVDIHKHKVRVKIIGRLNLLSEKLRLIIKKVEKVTKDYDEHFFNLAIAYGGRAEIVDAAKEIVKDVKKGKLKLEFIDEEVFEKYLYTAYLPQQEPDLIIRTSGEERMSGFLLYQSAYSELCFLDVYWPEFRLIDVLRVIRTFQKRKRRYGK